MIRGSKTTINVAAVILALVVSFACLVQYADSISIEQVAAGIRSGVAGRRLMADATTADTADTAGDDAETPEIADDEAEDKDEDESEDDSSSEDETADATENMDDMDGVDDGDDLDAEVVDASDEIAASELANMTTAELDTTSVCPIEMGTGSEEGKTMGAYLDGLIEPCTADVETSKSNETNLKFCEGCVRPLQTFLAREFHLADLLRNDTEGWDPSNTAIHEKCASDATQYMSDKGMPYDDNFHEAVFGCKDYADDPTCTIPTAELVESPGIKEAIEQCQIHQKDVSAIVKPAGTPDNGTAVSSDAMSEEHPFCTECYWKFFEALVKQTMSDEFMCKMKVDKESMTDEDVEKALLEDPHMFACLLNVEGYLREKGMESAAIGFTEMEAICLNDLNRPKDAMQGPAITTWMFQDDMKEKLDALECAR